MNTNDKMRHRCVNNQLCEQLCVKLHREPPRKWHVHTPVPITPLPPTPVNTNEEQAILDACGLGK
jgi:hypothetical protein